MKKLFVLPVCLIMALASCNENKVSQDEVARQRDSLMQIINQKDDELNDIMGCINEVQDGFRRINEAENRVTIADGSMEGASAKAQIRENMEYIEQAMQQNRDLIAQLQQKLKTTTFNAQALQKTIENLQAQLETQGQRIQELEAALAERDITIATQSEQIDNLNTNVDQLTAENTQKAQTVATQDKELNKAWFVFGTKSELKEQGILKSGDVLKNGDFNKDYFTQIDIRTVKEIKLYSKTATILTSHPSSSYSLEKDSKKEYFLRITNPTRFWSVSKYLVVQVK